MQKKYQEPQQASFEETKFAIEAMLEMYNSMTALLADFPLFPDWLESAIRWSEKLEWETEEELLVELWKLSDNLLFAFMAFKRFSMETK